MIQHDANQKLSVASLRDEFRFGVAQFMRDSITLRDCVDKYVFSLFCLGMKLVVL